MTHEAEFLVAALPHFLDRLANCIPTATDSAGFIFWVSPRVTIYFRLLKKEMAGTKKYSPPFIFTKP